MSESAAEPLPRHSRRLWLLLPSGIVLLAGLAAWRIGRSTADPRFVGTWRINGGSREVYWSSGMGASLNGNGELISRFHWSAEGSTFLRGQNAGGDFAHLAAWSWKTFGGPPGWLHDVVFVSPDEIQLTPRTPGTGMGIVTLRRVQP